MLQESVWKCVCEKGPQHDPGGRNSAEVSRGYLNRGKQLYLDGKFCGCTWLFMVLEKGKGARCAVGWHNLRDLHKNTYNFKCIRTVWYLLYVMASINVCKLYLSIYYTYTDLLFFNWRFHSPFSLLLLFCVHSSALSISLPLPPSLPLCLNVVM